MCRMPPEGRLNTACTNRYWIACTLVSFLVGPDSHSESLRIRYTVQGRARKGILCSLNGACVLGPKTAGIPRHWNSLISCVIYAAL